MLSGDQFRRLRLSRGLSQTDVAKKAGITKNYISMYENFKQDMNVDTYEKILRAVYECPDRTKEKVRQKGIRENENRNLCDK